MMPPPNNGHGPSNKQSDPVLGYRSYGEGGEKVIVLHDWMGDSANYDPIVPYLDPVIYTYLFADIRGYGKSRDLTGEYSVAEVAADVMHLADSLSWNKFHVIGHSMTGMVVQRIAVDDWLTGSPRLKSIVAITPVSAGGYPADEPTRQFLWDLIHKRDLSEVGFHLLTGQRLLPAWSKNKTERHLQTSTPEALKGYYRMWLENDFSEDVRRAQVGTPMLVIGGRQDLAGFNEEHLMRTFGTWYPNASFTFISEAGHYPMQETPVYLASLVQSFIATHR